MQKKYIITILDSYLIKPKNKPLTFYPLTDKTNSRFTSDSP